MGAASIMGAASMKKILLTIVALTALVATSAMAADVGVYGAPPPAPVYPVYSLYYKWTGCYIGGHVGGLWAHKEWVDHEPFWVVSRPAAIINSRAVLLLALRGRLRLERRQKQQGQHPVPRGH